MKGKFSNLEMLLSNTAKSLAHKPELFRALMEEELLVPVAIDGDINDTNELHILHWLAPSGISIVPVFTGVDKAEFLYKDVEKFYWLSAREILAITLGSVIVMNPTSPEEIEIFPDQVEGLLDGSIFDQTKVFTVGTESDFVVGEPVDYPYSLIDALTKLFSLHDSVNTAYLAQCFDPDEYDEPHILIGIECASSLDDILEDVGVVLSELSDLLAPVDFIRVGKGGGFDSYFTSKTTPFYQGEWGRKLRYCTDFGRA